MIRGGNKCLNIKNVFVCVCESKHLFCAYMFEKLNKRRSAADVAFSLLY